MYNGPQNPILFIKAPILAPKSTLNPKPKPYVLNPEPESLEPKTSEPRNEVNEFGFQPFLGSGFQGFFGYRVSLDPARALS